MKEHAIIVDDSGARVAVKCACGYINRFFKFSWAGNGKAACGGCDEWIHYGTLEISLKYHCIDCGRKVSRNNVRCGSCATRAQWADPEKRVIIQNAIELAWQDEERRQRLSEQSKARWAAGIFDTPEFRARLVERAKRMWDDGTWGTEEQLAQAQERTKALWAQGVFDNRPTNKLSEARKRDWQKPQYRAQRSGENNSMWRGGISFEPYPPAFNELFKRMIRERDGNKCAICHLTGKEVHHINYIKEDTIPCNCITLCKACHSSTNFNRAYWESVLFSLLQRRLDCVSELSHYGHACP